MENEKAAHSQALQTLQANAAKQLEEQRSAAQKELAAMKADADQQLHFLKQQSDTLAKYLDHELAREKYIHSLQFEKEFKLYETMWVALVELRRATVGLRPVYDQFDPKEPEEERKKKRMTAFIESYNSFIDAMVKHEPFYPKAVYEKLDELRMIARKEGFDFRRFRREGDDEQYWERQEENSKAILGKVDEISAAIRERIGLLTRTTDVPSV